MNKQVALNLLNNVPSSATKALEDYILDRETLLFQRLRTCSTWEETLRIQGSLQELSFLKRMREDANNVVILANRG